MAVFLLPIYKYMALKKNIYTAFAVHLCRFCLCIGFVQRTTTKFILFIFNYLAQNLLYWCMVRIYRIIYKKKKNKKKTLAKGKKIYD
jgi:hypothetical protein